MQTGNAPAKPLGGKGYGSTPHLPGSRVGPGDWHIHAGQARILTERARDRRDRVIVTEKLDGSCVVAARIDGRVVPVTRAGYHAATSPFRMHHVFAEWIARREDRIRAALDDGMRFAAEWLAQAHGTRYALGDEDELLVGFAVIDGKRRLPHDEARERMAAAGILGAHVVSDGPPLSVARAMADLGDLGRHGGLDPVEGAVWVCERGGAFDFIAKHVVAYKVDGKFLPGIGAEAEHWNLPTLA